MSSSTNNVNEELVLELVEEFVTRHRNGESPSVAEYCQLHPEFADEIVELFPTLLMLEGATNSSPQSNAALGKVGNYELVEEIGRGGMGIGYEAMHESLGRKVAVKILSSRLADSPKAIARFQREAKAVSNLHDTSIVPLYEVGVSEEQFFFAMQLIEGKSLDVAVSNAKSNLTVDPGRSGSSDSRANDSDGRNESIAWDRSGRFLIGNSGRNFANVWDTTTFQVKQRPFAQADDLESNRLWAIAVNQRDGRVAFGGSNSQVRVWDRRDDSVEVYEENVGETKRLAWATCMGGGWSIGCDLLAASLQCQNQNGLPKNRNQSCGLG